jgi:hypothetical protein
MNDQLLKRLEYIEAILDRIADALEGRHTYSLATQTALDIAMHQQVFEDPQQPGEIGLIYVHEWHVRKVHKKEKLMLDIYAMGWRSAGDYPHLSIHQFFWDRPELVPQAWIDAGLVEGAKGPGCRARCLYKVSGEKTSNGIYRLDALTVEIPPAGGDLPPLPCEVVQRDQGSNGRRQSPPPRREPTPPPAAGTPQPPASPHEPPQPPADNNDAFERIVGPKPAAPAEEPPLTDTNWFNRGQLIFVLKQATKEKDARQIVTWLRELEAAGRIAPDSDSEIIIPLVQEKAAAA